MGESRTARLSLEVDLLYADVHVVAGKTSKRNQEGNYYILPIYRCPRYRYGDFTTSLTVPLPLQSCEP